MRGLSCLPLLSGGKEISELAERRAAWCWLRAGLCPERPLCPSHWQDDTKRASAVYKQLTPTIRPRASENSASSVVICPSPRDPPHWIPWRCLLLPVGRARWGPTGVDTGLAGRSDGTTTDAAVSILWHLPRRGCLDLEVRRPVRCCPVLHQDRAVQTARVKLRTHSSTPCYNSRYLPAISARYANGCIERDIR